VNFNCVALMAGAVFCFGAAGLSLHRTRRFLSRAQAATGKVVRSERSHDGVSNPTFAAVVEFTAAGGKVVNFTKPLRTALEPVVGEPVQLLYDAEEPTSVKLGTPLRLYATACVIGCLGAALAILGYLTCRPGS
jgi:hypothetical protein